MLFMRYSGKYGTARPITSDNIIRCRKQAILNAP